MRPVPFSSIGVVIAVLLPVICLMAMQLDMGDVYAAETPAAWEAAATVPLDGLRVSLSKPVPVARSKGYLWFPTMTRLAGGELFAVLSTNLDAIVADRTAAVTWSGDGGLTWSELSSIDPKGDLYSESTLRLPNGDELLYPFNLYPRPDGMSWIHQIVSGQKGKREVRLVKEGLIVTGWPRPDRSFNEKLGLSGFGFNGQTLVSRDGSHLATLYGHFKDEAHYSLVLVESRDGIRWKYRTTIAGDDCKLEGGEGPCESAICRLKDGRLMGVFRLASNVPYGQTFSSDEGRTWTEPVAMANAFSVQPSLVVMRDGKVALSGGRPGLFLWINADGSGQDWQRVDILAHHNATHPEESIGQPGHTTSYTEIVALDDTHLIYMYDRVPHGWSAIPEESPDTNSIWVMRVSLEQP
ncbi:MAG: exo-alpha-sialidase [Rhodopirellula sp.]|nr:exo-alpha-sialidase [Rhodopirellula sp.]